MGSFLLIALALLLFLFLGVLAFISWGVRWGSSREEYEAKLPGDDYFAGGPPAYVAMTRAITIQAPPEIVWPWVAQMGRGAGFYSYDFLDNGRRMSAKHIVSWIPEPRVGDLSVIGILRHLIPNKELSWWVPGVKFLGAICRMAIFIQVRPGDDGSRLLVRISADASGIFGRPVLWVFRFMVSIMARKQLLNIKFRAEKFGARTLNPERPETGARDQYQYCEAIFQSGERAGVKGKGEAEQFKDPQSDYNMDH
ncbi:MAG: SRPBCC family protein [bacterium]|nr:SRPBCC family protein [bacterium]